MWVALSQAHFYVPWWITFLRTFPDSVETLNDWFRIIASHSSPNAVHTAELFSPSAECLCVSTCVVELLRLRRFSCLSQSLQMEILSSPRRSLPYLFKSQALVSEHCCLPTTVSHSLVTSASLPSPGYPGGRPLRVCRSARRVQPESQGDLPLGRLSPRSWGAPVTDAPLEQYPTPTGEQKYNSRTRPSLGGLCTVVLWSDFHISANECLLEGRLSFLLHKMEVHKSLPI